MELSGSRLTVATPRGRPESFWSLATDGAPLKRSDPDPSDGKTDLRFFYHEIFRDRKLERLTRVRSSPVARQLKSPR